MKVHDAGRDPPTASDEEQCGVQYDMAPAMVVSVNTIIPDYSEKDIDELKVLNCLLAKWKCPMSNASQPQGILLIPNRTGRCEVLGNIHSAIIRHCTHTCPT